MLSQIIIFTIALVALVSARAAPESKDSPTNVTYTAYLHSGSILAGVSFFSLDGYVSVRVVADYTEKKGPYLYRIHERAIPETGDCSRAKGDFNPYDGLRQAKDPADMEVGDLSGKHGLLKGRSYYATYEDRYLSLNPENRAYIGNLSVVVESADGELVACGNLEKK